MTSFLIIATDKKEQDREIQKLCKQFFIDTFDLSIITKEPSDKKTTQSIGIEDVLQIQKKLFFKPLKSQTKAVVIEEAHLLTIPAQNALLKVLEEPPEHTIIVLITSSEEALLPTIRSRCAIIHTHRVATKLTPREQTEITAFLKELPTMTIGQRLKKAETLTKDKEKAIAWIEKAILLLREQLLRCHSEQSDSEVDLPAGKAGESLLYSTTIKAFQSLHTLLKTTNVNPRFAIEHTLLSLL